MNVFREISDESSALEDYLEEKRREFIGASGDDIGGADALRLREDLATLGSRIERQLVQVGKASVCYLVMGRVQSGKTGHQLGMLAWAADRCDVAVIFTGVTEALNGQTSQRISHDLGALPSTPVTVLKVPTRTAVEADTHFRDTVLKRARQRLDFRGGVDLWKDPLPVLVSMKTKPRVDALKWLFQEVLNDLGEGVTVLIIDDEADQASPNAATRKNEEAATYAELKALRDAATRHVWLSYTATPQAIFLTELDGALRPDFCAVSRPGKDYFGVASLMDALHKQGRVEVQDWVSTNRKEGHVPASLRRALCDLLVAGWLRERLPEGFYRRAEAPGEPGMRSVQMLIHTSQKVSDHRLDYAAVEACLEEIRRDVSTAYSSKDASTAPTEMTAAWAAMKARVESRTGGTVLVPQLGLEQLYQLGQKVSKVETRVVNSDPGRPTASAGPLPTTRSGWEASPMWVVIGGDILGRGLTIPQLVTTYFTRMANQSNEDTVSQQMRFCGYRSTYSHVLSVHALPDIFEAFDYLSQVERALISRAEDWEAQDKNLRLDEPALWYVSRPTNRMKPTRLAVRDRLLVDSDRSNSVLSLRQFLQPPTLRHNAGEILAWVEQQTDARAFVDDWLLVECGAETMRELLPRLRMAGRDDGDRDVALELMNPRLADLGIGDLPFAVFIRGLDKLRKAAAGQVPDLSGIPVRRVAGSVPADALGQWRSGWTKRGGLEPESWFDAARLAVPHIGDAQRKPVAALGYDAVAVLIEPLAAHAGDETQAVAAGLAVSIQTPKEFKVRAIGVKAAP